MKTSDAEEYILGLNQKLFAGYNDWRLPTLEETMSLVEPRKRGELYIDPLFDRKQKWIWTSDNKLLDEGWVVNFAGGFCEAYLSDCSHYVRAVR
jgi:hypothetical protein